MVKSGFPIFGVQGCLSLRPLCASHTGRASAHIVQVLARRPKGMTCIICPKARQKGRPEDSLEGKASGRAMSLMLFRSLMHLLSCLETNASMATETACHYRW
mmetsp:Transcript_109020/g.348046  ORF Transcript_109020/g.348046 Transcript_109020/m.348046 type:complete len:102 (-) Transcript_109020:15-320(-)